MTPNEVREANDLLKALKDLRKAKELALYANGASLRTEANRGGSLGIVEWENIRLSKEDSVMLLETIILRKSARLVELGVEEA